MPPDQDGGNEDGTMVNKGQFQVPNTQIFIGLILGGRKAGPAQSMFNVLNGTQHFLMDQLAASGDGQIPQSHDPFYYDLEQGSWLVAESWGKGHFTWGILNATMGWMIPHLAPISKYRQYVGAYVTHSEWGLIGHIDVEAGYTGRFLPEILAGAAGVTDYTANPVPCRIACY